MATPEHLLMLGGATAGELFRAVERRGLRVVVLTVAELLDGAEPPSCAALMEAVDFRQPYAVIRRIRELNASYRFAGIVPVIEYGLEVAAIAATELGLPTNPGWAVRNTRSKLRMRRELERAGLGQVRYASCRSREEAERFMDQVDGPIFIKPDAGTGSDGVSRVDLPSQLAAAFELAGTSQVGGGILCEEYVAGPEVSLEGYSVAGRFVPVALTDKRIDERYLEIGHDQPTAQPEAVLTAAAELTARVLEALGVVHGVSHTELKLTPGGPVVIETHTRMAGGSIHVLTQRTTGVDLADLMVALALGERPQARPQATGRGASVRFLSGGHGRLTSLAMPPVEPQSGVESAMLYVHPGQTVRDRSSSRDRLGHAIAVGPTAAAAAGAAERFLARVRLDFEAEEIPCRAAS